MNYLISVIAVFGMCYIIGFSKLTMAIRTWLYGKGKIAQFFVEMSECMACLSVHIGWATTLAGISPFPRTVLGCITAALFYAGSSYLLAAQAGLTSLNFPESSDKIDAEVKE